MCDFSRYGGRTDEWLAIEATLAPRPPATGDTAALHALQAASNQEQTAASARDLVAFQDRVVLRDHTIPTRDGQTLEARSYWPRPVKEEEEEEEEEEGDTKKELLLPVYVHLHGGGFLYGSLGTEDATCARLAVRTGVVVLHVNYRHTPDHGYPTAFDDVEDGLAWLHDHLVVLSHQHHHDSLLLPPGIGIDPHRVVVGGVSAGAHLAASLLLRKNLGTLTNRAAQACPPVVGQVLMIPCVAHIRCGEMLRAQIRDESVWSYRENEEAPMLPVANVRLFLDLLFRTSTTTTTTAAATATDLRLNPGNASPAQVVGLPPTTVAVAGLDPLRDEGLLYAKLLAENGVPTSTHIFPGLPHGFRRFGDRLSASQRWDQVMEDGITWALTSPQATGQFVIQEPPNFR